MSEIKKYLTHLPNCGTQQNWFDAEQALADTPDNLKDDGYYLAVEEIQAKKNTCTCGLTEIKKSLLDESPTK